MPLPKTKDSKDRTVIKMSAAPSRRFVIANDNTVFYSGKTSKSYSLPDDQTKSAWTELKLSKESTFNDTSIVDVACGNHYTLFVTSKGNLYALGAKFWDKISQDGPDNKLGQVNLTEGWKVQRVWASYWKNETNCIIEVLTSDNKTEYHSIGEAEFGLLGQGSNEKGDKIKESKLWGKLSLPEEVTKLKQISMSGSHALAID